MVNFYLRKAENEIGSFKKELIPQVPLPDLPQFDLTTVWKWVIKIWLKKVAAKKFWEVMWVKIWKFLVCRLHNNLPFFGDKICFATISYPLLKTNEGSIVKGRFISKTLDNLSGLNHHWPKHSVNSNFSPSERV